MKQLSKAHDVYAWVGEMDAGLEFTTVDVAKTYPEFGSGAISGALSRLIGLNALRAVRRQGRGYVYEVIDPRVAREEAAGKRAAPIPTGRVRTAGEIHLFRLPAAPEPKPTESSQYPANVAPVPAASAYNDPQCEQRKFLVWTLRRELRKRPIPFAEVNALVDELEGVICGAKREAVTP